MSMHDSHHHDYFSSRFDGSVWPAVLMVVAIVAIAALAYAI
jgi:hypothetical protein